MVLCCPAATYWFGAAGASVVVSVMSVIGFVAAEAARVAAESRPSDGQGYRRPAALSIK